MSGVISRGVRAPIVREGDDIIKIVADSVVAAMAEDGFKLRSATSFPSPIRCCARRRQLRQR